MTGSAGPRAPRPRRGGPVVAVLADLIASAVWGRNWMVVFVVLLTIIAAVVAVAGQAVLPWAIYPAL